MDVLDAGGLRDEFVATDNPIANKKCLKKNQIALSEDRKKLEKTLFFSHIVYLVLLLITTVATINWFYCLV